MLTRAPVVVLLVACGDPAASPSRSVTSAGDDDDTATSATGGDPCEVPGHVCTWLGVAPVPAQDLTFAGFSGEGLPRTNPAELWPETTLLYLPVDISFAPDGTAYYPDYNNHRLRRVDLDGLVTTVSGTGVNGDGLTDPPLEVECWDGCEALASRWAHPTDVVLDPADPDRLYVAAFHNFRVSVVDGSSGLMSWVAGTGQQGYGAADLDLDGDFLDDCSFDAPSSVAFSSDGGLYVSDQSNHVIRRIDRAAGTITVIAGEPGVPGAAGDGGPASLAHLHGSFPQVGSKLAIGPDDVLVAADTENAVVRTVDLATGVIDTLAGSFVRGYAGDGGPATDARLDMPTDVAVGLDGEVYIADTKNNCVRVVRDGIIDRFAGRCGEPEAFGGDGGPALDASFGNVYGLAVDPEGDVYVTDTNHHVVRRVKR